MLKDAFVWSLVCGMLGCGTMMWMWEWRTGTLCVDLAQAVRRLHTFRFIPASTSFSGGGRELSEGWRCVKMVSSFGAFGPLIPEQIVLYDGSSALVENEKLREDRSDGRAGDFSLLHNGITIERQLGRQSSNDLYGRQVLCTGQSLIWFMVGKLQYSDRPKGDDLLSFLCFSHLRSISARKINVALQGRMRQDVIQACPSTISNFSYMRDSLGPYGAYPLS
jgi:hypothetical protein